MSSPMPTITVSSNPHRHKLTALINLGHHLPPLHQGQPDRQPRKYLGHSPADHPPAQAEHQPKGQKLRQHGPRRVPELRQKAQDHLGVQNIPHERLPKDDHWPRHRLCPQPQPAQQDLRHRHAWRGPKQNILCAPGVRFGANPAGVKGGRVRGSTGVMAWVAAHYHRHNSLQAVF